MATEFKLPKLGESTEKGQVTKILVSVGDTIQADQPVIELETDKATVEVPSSVGGVVKEIRVKAEQEIGEGDVILTVEEAGVGEATEKAALKEKEEPSAKSAAKEEPEAGGKELGREPAGAAEQPVQEVVQKGPRPKAEKPEPQAAIPVPAAPSVRQFAREMGVDIAQVPGTGPAGRISVEDVKEYVRTAMKSREQGTDPGFAAPPLPDLEAWGAVKREPMSNIRRRTAQRLSVSWSQIPHVTQFDRADITELERLRKHAAKKVEQAGGRLTITIIAAKVAASALRAFPKFNASIDMQRGEIVYKAYCNIGIAVDTDRGLLVPVVKGVDEKNMTEIAVEIGDLAEKARSGKIQPDDMQGGTFTITNLGSIGGTHFTPIVKFPEVAILGIGRAFREPGVAPDAPGPRLILPLSLSYDHRIIDGAEGARFLRQVAETLEDPLLLSLDG